MISRVEILTYISKCDMIIKKRKGIKEFYEKICKFVYSDVYSF